MEAVECNGRGVVASYRQVLRGQRANLKPDGYSLCDACGEAIVTAREKNSDRRQAVEEEKGGLEGQLGTDKGNNGSVADTVLMEGMMSRESHFASSHDR